MDRQWKWKVLGVVGLVVLSILMLVPTFVGTGKAGADGKSPLPEWYSKVFDQRLVLGLDLQGGIHLQYKVDIAEALARRTAQLAGNLEESLKTEAGVTAKAVPANEPGPGASLDEVTTMKVTFESEADAEKLDRDFLARFLPDYEVGGTDGNVVTLLMTSEAIDSFREDAVQKAIETINRRINEFGVAESTITRRGDDELVVQLPGIKEEDFGAAKEKLSQTGQLRFQIVDQEGTSAWIAKVFERKPDPANWPEGLDPELKKHKVVNLGYTVRSTSRELLEYMVEGQVDADHIVGYEELFVDPRTDNLDAVETLSAEQEQSLRRQREFDPDASVVKAYQLHYLLRKEGMSGDKVVDARVGFDQFNRPEVYMTFDRSDADKFYEMTKKHVRDQMAIMIDEIVYSAPVIEEPIPGGNVRIRLGSVGQQAFKEASALVAVLKSGALQAPLRKLYDSQVGPSLGADSIEAGKLSIAIGFAAVVLFMLVYYKAAGLVANLALFLNVLFVLAMLTAFGATLTLPGIAGIVLTIGMAVDTNVLIFERIREELRAGKAVRQAIDLGYDKALSAIIDGNVTTAIAAVVLYQFGSGPIRGFAVTLAIGIVCSVFTALIVTRLVFQFFYGRGPAPQKMSI